MTAVALRPATWQAFARVYRPLGEQVSAATADLPDGVRRAVVAAMAQLVDEAPSRPDR